jgi:hypothetical protein
MSDAKKNLTTLIRTMLILGILVWDAGLFLRILLV